MLYATFLIWITVLQSPIDFSITLSYHPQPFFYQEWYITIARTDSKAYIETNNPKFLRKKQIIPLNEYAHIIQKLISMGIWQCKDYYTYGNYYMIEIIQGNYRHQCKIEYSSSLPAHTNYNILRVIMNAANVYLQ